MLFTIIRDWFVQYVWGGVLSSGTVVNVGRLARLLSSDGSSKLAGGSDLFIPVHGAYFDGTELVYINIADWLSTTSAVITMVILLIFIGIFIHWCFKLVSGLILLRR